MRLLKMLCLSASVAASGSAAVRAEPRHPDLAPQALSSPMVDKARYRDGEVRRLSGVFGGWDVVCDEIVSRKQRFCSLKTLIKDGEAHVVGRLDMSTDDRGQPVALVHVPLGAIVHAGVDVTVITTTPSQKAATHAKPPRMKNLPILVCDTTECLAVWTLDTTDLADLTQATALQFRFGMVGTGVRDPFAVRRFARQTTMEGRVSPTGFAAAVTASMQ